MRGGWRPVAFGAAFGVLLGFGGGAAKGLISSVSRVASGRPLAAASAAPEGESKVSSADASGAKALSAPRSGPAQPSATCGSSRGRLVRFRVLVEDGLEQDAERFVADVLSVLCDRRSWIGSGRVRFRYDPAGPLLIGLRTPDSTEGRCRSITGLSVHRYYSCGSYREVALNADRWLRGSDHWPGPLAEYRRMLVNHEVGHAIGQRHRSCGKEGAEAPVMMQQSKGTTTSGRTCKPNPWPLSSELSTAR